MFETAEVGLKLTKFSELSNRLAELLDAILEVTKKTRGEYSNVYFNRRIQVAGLPAINHSVADTPF